MICRRVLFLLLIGASGVLRAQTDASPAELERINAAIEKVRDELAGTRSERNSLASDIEASEKAILDNARQIAAVHASIAESQAALDGLATRRQQLDVERAAQQELVATYVRGAWMAGNEEYLKLVLNQEDPQRSARLMRYYTYFSAARARKVAAFNQTLAELALVAADVETTTAALQQQQQTLALEQQGLAVTQQQRRDAITRLDADVATRDAELQQLEMDKIEIEILLQELQNSIVDIPLEDEQEPFADRKGLMSWPLDGPHLNAFGSRHSLGDLTWEGVTIGATAGADVRAIHHGRVVFADWFNTSGLLLIIDHGGGYMSLYAHTQELYKAVGEWVAAGDVIAAAGNTGGQREPSLYFEIRRNGRAENPVNWCVARR
jgi:septal ring factor EnvC (AmiA/AmiB activator)